METALPSLPEPKRSFGMRCADLAMRAAVLALGLPIGGVGPVLGEPMKAVKLDLSVNAPAGGPGWTYGNEPDGGPLAYSQTAGKSAFEDAIADSPLWREWRFDTLGREQVFGVGLLYPGAKPDIMRKRARLLELRFYMPY